MENNEIKERIRKTLVLILKHENFEMVDGLTAADVDGWDSLTHMEIISSLEDDFNIKFKLRELNKLKDMKSLVDLIDSKL